MGVLYLHGVCKVVDIPNEEVRDSDSDLAVVKTFPVALELGEKSAELHSKIAFQINNVIFVLWALELGHQG
jgi:hypothetical protein